MKKENDKIIYTSISYNNLKIKEIINSRDYTWQQLVSGLKQKNVDNFNVRNNILYDTNTLYPGFNSLPDLLDMFETNKAIIDFIDTSEEESALIATTVNQVKDNKYYTHVEIDPSLMFGVMGNSITYPEANQLPRNVFSCGQSRQAVSVYHSNYQMRLDKMGVVLNYGQTPLIKSRYLEYINQEQQPYGVNAIVAIMSYTGYNVEDAILINKGSIDRGIFRTMYYTSYESRETSSKVAGSDVNSFFTNIEAKQNVTRLKEGFDYSQLDEYGLIKENTVIDDNVVIIGQVSSTIDKNGEYIDNSVTTKKGQLGFVDKSFISEGEEGFRISKIRIREERFPAIGDKMASRCGQKGTIGLIIPEEDMPFTADGVRPDLIINPHAIPSRMTIGQLIECLFGEACAIYGGYGDCTAYATKGANYKTYGEMLTKMDFHCSGNQILYNGYTGEQIYSEIFIGPTYDMRLKHMVKDKINYRATGKRSALTRQTNQGRANDGGLRLGEMERDGIMANGLSYFLNESYMVRGDQYYMAVCNKTGTIAVYNPDKNLFLSPMSDGPLVFNKNPEGEPILDVFSKFGRSFSLLRIPYALKLLIQELQVLNVQMRIITEENVDQLLNLSYQSKNISKLLHINDGDFKDINTLVTEYKKRVDEKTKNQMFADNALYNKNQLLQQNIKQVEPQLFDEIKVGNNLDQPPSEPNFEKDPDMWYPSSENEFERGQTDALLAWSNEKIDFNNISLKPNLDRIAPPAFTDIMLIEKWYELTIQEQEQVIALPTLEQQEIVMKSIISRKRDDFPLQVPNYGSDGELNYYFSMLPKQEQIELLKLSHERQIEKLIDMAKANKELDDFSSLRITIPKNKTTAEELYESDKFKILAPTENNSETNSKEEGSNSNSGASHNNNDSNNSNNSNNSNSNIKKISF